MPKLPAPSQMSDHASIPSIAGDGSGESASAHLWKRHLEIKRVDNARNDLVEELLHRYDSLSDVFKQECEDHEREREFNRRCQRKLKELGSLVHRYEGDLVQPHSSPNAANQAHTLQDLESYVLVLIDGDGLIFNDSLLLDGASGGQRAAGLLEQYVYDYVRAEHPEIPPAVKISARVYANVKGLSETCRRASITSKTSDLHEFVIGFSQGKFLMDFVDVGAGKDRADQKVVEQLKLNLRNRHCRQILLGGSHDNGYTRILGEVVNYEQAVQKITLIEGVPFAREYGALPFRVHKFGDLFRPQKINLYDQGFPTPFPPGLSPFQNRMQSPISTSSIMTPNDNPNMSPASVASPTATSTGWANVAAKAARLPAPINQTPPMRDTSGIPRNRKGQRIDPPTSNPGIDEVTRVKRMKMCNVHFLRNECPYGKACTHVHEYKPTKAELDTLRLVARSQPCIHGTGCNDAKCIYGHRCPHPKAGKSGGGAAGGKNCHFFDECKFPVEMHNMDLGVVQFQVVR